MYNVIDPQEDLKDTPPVPSIDNIADLNRSLLMDIIYVSAYHGLVGREQLHRVGGYCLL